MFPFGVVELNCVKLRNDLIDIESNPFPATVDCESIDDLLPGPTGMPKCFSVY